MSELIQTNPNPETEERAFWDGFIRSLNRLSDIVDSASDEHDAIDLFEVLDAMQEKTKEDALTLLYNYVRQLAVSPEQSSNLVHIKDFLGQNGFVEFQRETE
jgi:hypothetical protein